MYINGYDREGRPVMYVKPGAYNPYGVGIPKSMILKSLPKEQRCKYLVWSVEKAISQMDTSSGVEKICWICDFSGMLCCDTRHDIALQTMASVLNLLMGWRWPKTLSIYVMLFHGAF